MASEIEEIEKQAADLTLKLKAILVRKNLSDEQVKTTADAYNGLLWWRRTQLVLMIKAFGGKSVK